MKADELLDAVGDVDDILIKRAKEAPRPYRRMWAVIGSAAACLVLICLLPIVVSLFRNAESETTDSSDKMPQGSDCVRVDVTENNDSRFISDQALIKQIDGVISDITSATDLTESGKITENENIEVIIPESAAEGSKPSDGEYIITLTYGVGNVRRYRLTASTLTDIDIGAVYDLTDEQSELLMSLILP